MAGPEELAKQKLQGEVKLGHNLLDILPYADSPLDWPSFLKLYNQLCAGIFLKNRTKRYWFDNKTDSNCFMLFARDLTIAWSENPQYWRWEQIEAFGHTIEIAVLLAVSWLNVHGKINTSDLSVGKMYKASFMVMIVDAASGFDVPLNIEFKKPDGSKQQHQVDIQGMPRRVWLEISIAEFMVNDYEKGGEIECTLFDHRTNWKRGLLVKGILIQTIG